ncbi:MAG: OmpH family outer membrane protein [Deferribacteres bacterium]|nr:OmpH family outer membrane protein [Deferribacteres bacterium]
MRKTVFVIILSVFALALSAQASDLKIACVDLNRALNQSDEGKKAIKILEEMRRANKERLIKKNEEIKKIEEEIAKQASILNPEAIKKKKEEREKLIRDFQRLRQDSQDEYRKKENDFVQKIFGEMRVILTEIADKEGYTVVFEKNESGILYISKKLDLTDKLISEFNKRASKKAGKSKKSK